MADSMAAQVAGKYSPEMIRLSSDFLLEHMKFVSTLSMGLFGVQGWFFSRDLGRKLGLKCLRRRHILIGISIVLNCYAAWCQVAALSSGYDQITAPTFNPQAEEIQNALFWVPLAIMAAVGFLVAYVGRLSTIQRSRQPRVNPEPQGDDPQ